MLEDVFRIAFSEVSGCIPLGARSSDVLPM